MKYGRFGVGVVAALSLSVAAYAQQPPPHPQPQPGQAGRPVPMPGPGGRGANGARPLHAPGGPGGLPGMPPGMPRPRRPAGAMPGAHGAAPQHAAAGHGEGHEGGEQHHAHGCPGHGPNDPPPPVNWFYGWINANSELAKQGGLMHVLFRYENEQNECDPKNEPPPFLATVANFAILAFIVGKYGKKPLAEALVKRRQSIMAEIDNATRLKEEAEDRLAEYEDKFENLNEKLDEMRAEYAAQSTAEKQRILDEAEERRVRMRRDAEFRIDQDLKTAKAELLREAVLASTEAARALLTSKMGASDHDRIAEEYLKAVGPAVKGPATATFGGAS